MREKLRAFTLVELIVVITILAILSTIWFISFQGYTSQSRDSVRVSDMKIVEKALVLNNVTSGNYPVPGNIDASVTHWKQWEVSKEVLARLQWISQVPVDPLTKTPMKYATTHDSKQFQLKYDLEAISQWKISQIYARNIAHKITWNYNGLFLVWNDNVYYSSIWLHSSGSTFYVNSWTVDFNIQKLQDSSNTDITPGNVESNYPDFSLALIEKYENNTDLESNWKQELLNLDKNNEYELAQFAIKILNHNPKKLKELWFTAPVEWSLPHSWECVDSVTPTDESYFNFNESTNTITWLNWDYPKNIVIPCEINDIKAIYIWNLAFMLRELESVILSDNIKSVWEQSFIWNNITSLDLWKSLETIWESAFSSIKTNTITIPDSVTNIWKNAFSNNNITSLTLWKSLETIWESAFSSIKTNTITIPDSVTNIWKNAFSNSDITNLTLWQNVETIWEAAFRSIKTSTITIPNSVINIWKDAFAYSDITNLTLWQNVETIWEAAFRSIKTSTITIPNSVINIWKDAFAYSNITTLTLWQNVETIWEAAFRSNDITQLVIPANVIIIWKAAFRSNDITQLDIPATVTNIWESAFRSNDIFRLTILWNNLVLDYDAFASQWITEWPIIAWDNFCDTYYHEDYIDTGSLTSCSQ